MHALRPLATVPYARARRPVGARPERDFGIGYGRSSGYASLRRYASNWAPPRFRFA
jgi:hypothetical protein